MIIPKQARFSSILILFISLISCGKTPNYKQSQGKVADSYKPIHNDTILSEKLELAYKLNSKDSLENFFSYWNQTIKSNDKSFIEQNDTIKAVFDAFKMFYKPLELLNLGTWICGYRFNTEFKYVVVQNNIDYSVIMSNNFKDIEFKNISRETISNFRPPISLDSKNTLYLTSEYEIALYQFLGTDSNEVGSPKITTPSRTASEKQNRYNMIRTFIPVICDHWGLDWLLATRPYISLILFNKNLTIAKIYFSICYEWGEAILIKGFSGWIIKERHKTGIE